MRRSTIALAALFALTAACVDQPVAPPGDLADPAVSLVPGFSYSIRESFAIPSGATVVAARDMDGDGILDVVSANWSTRTVYVTERQSGGWTLAATLGGFSTIRGRINVEDLDGDGLPEIVVATFGSARIIESTGNDMYAVKATLSGLGTVEQVTIGDTDGDGRPEVVTAREGFPSYFYAFEATGNDSYALEATMTGIGGDANHTGTFDMDGAGGPRLRSPTGTGGTARPPSTCTRAVARSGEGWATECSRCRWATRTATASARWWAWWPASAASGSSRATAPTASHTS